MKSKILKEKKILDSYLSIYEAELQHELFDGSMSPVYNRFALKKNEVVAILLVDKQSNELILVEQYRYPTDAWEIEVIAGGVEESEDIELAAKREVLEETGFYCESIKQIHSFYASPGISDEEIHLFIATIDSEKSILDTSKIKDEGEDIRLLRIPISELNQYILKMTDAKTLIALYYYDRKKNRIVV